MLQNMHAMHKLISKDAFVNGYENSSGVWYMESEKTGIVKRSGFPDKKYREEI